MYILYIYFVYKHFKKIVASTNLCQILLNFGKWLLSDKWS